MVSSLTGALSGNETTDITKREDEGIPRGLFPVQFLSIVFKPMSFIKEE